MEIHEILESLKKGKISVNNAKKLLSLYSIEEVEGFAKIDINRRNRRDAAADHACAPADRSAGL